MAIIVQLTDPVFTAFSHGFSWRDMILIAGGPFLVWKATKEIHHNVDPDHGPDMFEGKSSVLGMRGTIGHILAMAFSAGVGMLNLFTRRAARRPSGRDASER